jgi:hypothetical protein
MELSIDMPAFLYGFGYEDKDEMEYNRLTNSDFESSTGVLIDAPSEADALAWGIEISEAFLRHIHRDPAVSWKALNYAHWIEADPESCSWKHCLSFFPRVRVGELPDFSQMTSEAYVRWSKEHGLRDA